MVSTLDKEFASKLEGIQHRHNYTDQQMAQEIGCSRQLYQLTRTGKIPVGNKILKGVVKAFPELSGDVYIFLTNGADTKAERADKSTTPHQTALSKNLAAFKGLWVSLYTRIKRLPFFKREITLQ